MQCGERPDAVACGGELGARFRLPDPVGLEVQQGGDDLQVVLHPVVDLLDQQRLMRLRQPQPLLVRAQGVGGVGKGARQLPQLDRR